MLGWGLVTVCTVVVYSYSSLIVVRVFVGVCEAFVQGSVFYLSFWYPYNELATRGAIYFSTAALAGAFNGLIAYAVQKDLRGVNSWEPWRWLFLIEGVIPICWAFVVMLLLPSTPEHLKLVGRFFTKEEKKVIVKRSRLARNTGESKIRPKLILVLLMDPKFWMLVCIESATLFCLTSLSNFLPAILHGFGWSSVKSQLMTIIVYACAFVTIIFWARFSDKVGRRGIVIIANACIGALGYVLLITLKGNSGRFAATCKSFSFTSASQSHPTSVHCQRTSRHRHRRNGNLPKRSAEPHLGSLDEHRLHLPRVRHRADQLHRPSRLHRLEPSIR
jgi:MFS family permease